MKQYVKQYPTTVKILYISHELVEFPDTKEVHSVMKFVAVCWYCTTNSWESEQWLFMTNPGILPVEI